MNKNNESVLSALQEMGQQLKTYRKEVKNCSVEQMAKEMEISQMTYWRMEQGASGVGVGFWLSAWWQMNVLNNVVAAAEPDLLEAQAKDFPDYGNSP